MRAFFPRVSRVVCAGALLAAFPASAQHGLYLGGGVGVSYGSFDGNDFSTGSVQQSLNEELAASSLPATAAVTSSDFDKEDFGWKLFVGYRFNEYIGIEGSYANFGKFKANYQGNYLGSQLSANVDYKVDSWNLMGVLRYPYQKFSFQAKLGAAFTKATNELSASLGGISDSAEESKSKTNFLWGLGVGYNFTPNVAILGEYENYGKVGDSESTGRVETSLWSVSLLYSF